MRLLIALLLMLTVAPAWAAPAASFQEIEESLTCQCGCGLTVHSCNHLQCPSAIPLRQEIREQMAKGLGKSDILAYFQQKYGEKILSSPTTTGFNIAAWTVPFVVIAIGGLIIGVVLVRWRRTTGEGAVPVASAPPSATDPGLKAKLERELADLERRS